MHRKTSAKRLLAIFLGFSALISAQPQNSRGSARIREWSITEHIRLSSSRPSIRAGKTAMQQPTPKTDHKQETQKQPRANSGEANTQRNKLSLSPVDKKEQAMSLLDGTLYSTKQISPAEYRILVEVKAATLLWQFDRERSTTILKGAVATMRKIKEDEQHSSLSQQSIDKSTERLRFLVLRKIAALNPGLVKDLFVYSEQPGTAVDENWTEEARAVMSVATDEIESNPKIAGRLAEQSIPLGLSDWDQFLDRLSERDPAEAERLAILVMNQLRSSNVTPIAFQYLRQFVFGPAASSSLQEYYFQSVAIRLGREMFPGTSARDLQDALNVSRDLSVLSGARSERWQSYYVNLTAEFEAQFKARSLDIPGQPPKRMMDVSMLSSAASADTQGIRDQLRNVGSMRNAELKNRQYQKLAANAALGGDMSLAIEIMSMIDDEEIRREATLLVYGPFVRKALEEADWARAQNLALNVSTPLGRTLVFDRIAQRMSSAAKEKDSVKEVYLAAVKRLEKESSTEEVAKGLLIVARALLPLDQQAGIDTIKSAAFVINRMPIKSESFGKSISASPIALWVQMPNYSLRVDEVLETTDMLETVFKETAKRDVEAALALTDDLTHSGFRSLARLAVAEVLFDQVKNAPADKKSMR